MNNGKHGGRRAGRFLSALALPTILLFGATACSGNDPAAGNDSATVTPDAKQALAALNAGLKAHAAGDLVTAAADYNKALKYDGTNKFAFYNLALIDEANGNYGLAEDKYRSALKTDPAYEPALFNLAILRTARNDPKEAISLYERAVVADKKDAAAWLNLGLLLRADGQERVGDKDVLRAIGLDPSLKDPVHPAAGNGPTSP
jgi:tetratricopeptide (TPR) repeat protein